jgi:hypothetical protein
MVQLVTFLIRLPRVNLAKSLGLYVPGAIPPLVFYQRAVKQIGMGPAGRRERSRS